MPHPFLSFFLAAVCAIACTKSDAATQGGSPPPAVTAAASRPGKPLDSLSDLADRGRILGDSAATIWVIEASDFQCPYCKQWHDAAFQPILAKYVKTGRVRLAFLNLPLSMHPNAVPASEAAMCASIQNKFWPLHESLFATQEKWERLSAPVPAFDSLAAAAGADMPSWRKCMSDHSTLALIQADHDRAVAAGVTSTPSFFVGTEVLSGANAKVAEAIDHALAAPAAAKK